MVKKWRFWEDIKCAITIGKSSLAHFEIMFSKTILDLFYANIWPKKTPNKTKVLKVANLVIFGDFAKALIGKHGQK